MIEVGRNSIVVRNVDLESTEFKKLNSTFSLYDQVQHKYTFGIFTIIDKDIYLPESVGYERLQSFFPKKDVIINYKTTAKAARIMYNMKHTPRDDLQRDAIKFLSGIKNDDKNRSRFLSLATGMGKTFVTIHMISQLKKRPMIIVDTVDLASQWKREFLNHTDLTDSDVHILSGQASIDAELQKKVEPGKIYIAIHRTLSNMLAIDTNSVNFLMNKLQIGIRVFDESHVEFNNICKINSLSNVEYTLYLTATPNRSNFKDDNLYGKVFGKIPYFNGSNDKHITAILYPMNSQPSVDVRMGVRTKYGFNQARWAQHIIGDGYDTLLETVSDIFEKFTLLEREKKIVIMLPTIELIKKLKNDIEEAYNIKVGMFIGEVNKKKRLEELSNPVVITNDKIFGKAIDDENLEILINFVPVGSLVKVEQIAGRLRYHEGKSSILIDVYDNGFDECIRQFKIRRRFYKKKCKKIIEVKNTK